MATIQIFERSTDYMAIGKSADIIHDVCLVEKHATIKHDVFVVFMKERILNLCIRKLENKGYKVSVSPLRIN